METQTSHDLGEESLLVARARQGDRAAFDRLAAEYRRVLFGLAHTHAAGADADDLVQEILVRAWENLPGLRVAQAFPAWLTTLAVNLCRRRGAQAARRLLSLEDEADAWASALPDPLDTVLRREHSAEVRAALLAIPEANRRALILHLWGQYSYAEIADRMGTPLTTVEGRIHRAKAQLRQLLGYLEPERRGPRRGETQMATRSRAPAHPVFIPQIGHSTGIYNIAVSPDGKHLATAAGNGLVVLWNLETGRQEARVTALTAQRPPVFSPDGRWLAVPDGIRHTAVIDVRRGMLARTLEARAWALAFSPDGDVLHTASWTPSAEEGTWLHTTVSSFNVKTGKVLRRVEGLPGFGMLMSRDGSRLVTMVSPPPGEDGLPSADKPPHFCVWALPEGEPVSVLEGLLGRPHGNAAAMSPDNMLVAIASCFGGPSRGILVWETETGRLRHTFDDYPEEDPVYGLAFHPCEPALVSTHQEWEARVWDLAGRQRTRNLERTVRSDGISFFPDGRRLAGTGGGGVLWNWESGEVCHRFRSYRPNPRAVTFSPGGEQLAIAYANGCVLWNAATGSLARRVESSGNTSRRLVHFTADGRRLLAAGGRVDGTSGTWHDMLKPPSEPFVWSTETGDLQRPFPDGQCIVHGLAASPDGTRAAAVLLQPENAPIPTLQFGPGHIPRWEGSLAVWETDTWQVVWELPCDTCPLEGDVVAFSPDGALVAAGGWAQKDSGHPAVGEITVWDVERGEVRHRWEQAETHPEAIAFHPDGALLAAAFWADTWNPAGFLEVRAWDVGSGAPGPEYRCSGDLGYGTCVRFSPNGSALAAGTSDGYLVLWDADTARVRRAFRAHAGAVNGLDFSAEGRSLATAGSDGVTRVWRVADLLAKGPVREAAALVWSGGDRWLAYTPEGDYECPPDAEDLLLWRVDTELLPAERMRERFHHPQRVAAALRGEG